MPQTVADVMTKQVISLPRDASITDAARLMRDRDVGDVIVMKENDEMCGIVTDRDVVVRALAEGRNPQQTTLGDICTHELVTASPDEAADDAVRKMREHAIRRLPVTQNGKPMGFVSMGDLAIARDPGSALADVSEEPQNNV